MNPPGELLLAKAGTPSQAFPVPPRAEFGVPASAGPSCALDRRNFFKVAIAATGVASLSSAASAPAPNPSPVGLIDTNVNLSHWPLRRLPFDEPAVLAAKLRAAGVTQAWAGSFDGLLHRDLATVNARLADDCRRHGRNLLVPFGSINPKLPDWEEELRRCAETHHMPGIRLHPGYHGYPLDDPDFARLLRLAARRSLVVQLVWIMEDRRMMHPLLQVEPPDVKPLAEVVRKTPGLRLVLLNALKSLAGPALLNLCKVGEVHAEIAMLEGVGGVGNLLTQVPANRVVFGSHAPLFYFESALLKLQESPLSEEVLQGVRSENARRLLVKP